MSGRPEQSRLTLVLATANPDKASEIAAILSSAAVDLVPRPPDVEDVEETGDTLLENARLKARALATATGRPAIADDTGLEVDALGGAPGVYSARYAGEDATYADNVVLLLAEVGRLAGAGSSRRARFRTVALVAFPDGSELSAEGVVEGRIAEQARGTAGFGYDPVFIPEGVSERTFAEMSAEEKHACSHRGRAFRQLAERLEARGAKVDHRRAARRSPRISTSRGVVSRHASSSGVGERRHGAHNGTDPRPCLRSTIGAGRGADRKERADGFA